jgi:ribonucleoside-diphosphate reductase alpha chain
VGKKRVWWGGRPSLNFKGSSLKIRKVKKRNQKIVPFEASKITQAIERASQAANQPDGELVRELTSKVVAKLEKKFAQSVPSVEDIQDLVEETLIEENLPHVAKAYILYRQKRAEMREAKKFIGVIDDLKLSVNAIQVLKRRYLLRDETGEIKETPRQMFERVAKAVALVDEDYGEDAAQAEETFFNLLSNLEFLPNSPTLMNAGTPIGQLSACFVIPVEDSLEGIFEAVKNMAIIQKSGGGTGFSFSHLRPAGDMVKSTMGIASGPVSFMRVFDVTTDVIKQGGKRRGANMGILHVQHPDIFEFITAKREKGNLANFNISVAVTDRFMEAVKKDDYYYLINPRNNKRVKKVKARAVFDLIVANAWKTGDPGLVFIDEVNRKNPTPLLGKIESTNPCGEEPLLPYESCNLGSINLSRMVRDGEVDWEKLKKVTETAVHFLDNVIDANAFPIPQIEQVTKANRKIGLGVMGFAEMLILLNLPYQSEEALKLAEKLMKFINETAHLKSQEIAKRRGSFPAFKGSIWEKLGYGAMRNSTCTTVAPTGTISIIANTTSGIEPLFAVSFVRDVLEGTKLLEVNSLFEATALSKGFYSRELMLEIAKTGSIKDLRNIPSEVKRIFQTALDIDPEWHVRVQAAFQKYTDNAVSKTVNLPQDATTDKVREIYQLAYQLKCKGITVYRYGSKKEQVLYLGNLKEDEKLVSAKSEYSGGCPATSCPF